MAYSFDIGGAVLETNLLCIWHALVYRNPIS